MGPGDHPQPASQLREQLRAETILARMVMTEETARLAEEHPLLMMRQRFAEQYLRYVGIEPQIRHELRPVLEGIRQTGFRSVEDAIGELRSRYANGFGSRGDGHSTASS